MERMVNLREFIYLFILIFIFTLFYNSVLVLPYIDMTPPRVYMSSQTWTPLPPIYVNLKNKFLNFEDTLKL